MNDFFLLWGDQVMGGSRLTKLGGELLSRGCSIIAAEDFRFPVRDGMERWIPRYDHLTK